eukprot:TRINITY_DN1575_c2_g1_i1.p1 TRINITY_DN1575_c2_g1~~TRINITY_DN1575_c2_g1_i1.p1  ORF type:complete len:737 (+),score=151.17 TRINITY_DN1575_c2_g1_i1:83-2293(+)
MEWQTLLRSASPTRGRPHWRRPGQSPNRGAERPASPRRALPPPRRRGQSPVRGAEGTPAAAVQPPLDRTASGGAVPPRGRHFVRSGSPAGPITRGWSPLGSSGARSAPRRAATPPGPPRQPLGRMDSPLTRRPTPPQRRRLGRDQCDAAARALQLRLVDQRCAAAEARIRDVAVAHAAADEAERRLREAPQPPPEQQQQQPPDSAPPRPELRLHFPAQHKAGAERIPLSRRIAALAAKAAWLRKAAASAERRLHEAAAEEGEQRSAAERAQARLAAARAGAGGALLPDAGHCAEDADEDVADPEALARRLRAVAAAAAAAREQAVTAEAEAGEMRRRGRALRAATQDSSSRKARLEASERSLGDLTAELQRCAATLAAEPGEGERSEVAGLGNSVNLAVAEARWLQGEVWTCACEPPPPAENEPFGAPPTVSAENFTPPGGLSGAAVLRAPSLTGAGYDTLLFDEVLPAQKAANPVEAAAALRASALLATRGVTSGVVLLGWPTPVGPVVAQLIAEAFAFAASHSPEWRWHWELAAAEENQHGVERDLLNTSQAGFTALSVTDLGACQGLVKRAQAGRSGGADAMYVLRCTGDYTRSLYGRPLRQQRDGCLVVVDAAAMERGPASSYLRSLASGEPYGSPPLGPSGGVAALGRGALGVALRRIADIGGALAVAAGADIEHDCILVAVRLAAALRGRRLPARPHRRWTASGSPLRRESPPPRHRTPPPRAPSPPPTQ